VEKFTYGSNGTIPSEGGMNVGWIENGDWINHVQSGLCLDASGLGTADGTRMHLWACHGGTNHNGPTELNTGILV
jgi:hypothetical protein